MFSERETHERALVEAEGACEAVSIAQATASGACSPPRLLVPLGPHALLACTLDLSRPALLGPELTPSSLAAAKTAAESHRAAILATLARVDERAGAAAATAVAIGGAEAAHARTRERLLAQLRMLTPSSTGTGEGGVAGGDSGDGSSFGNGEPIVLRVTADGDEFAYISEAVAPTEETPLSTSQKHEPAARTALTGSTLPTAERDTVARVLARFEEAAAAAGDDEFDCPEDEAERNAAPAPAVPPMPSKSLISANASSAAAPGKLSTSAPRPRVTFAEVPVPQAIAAATAIPPKPAAAPAVALAAAAVAAPAAAPADDGSGFGGIGGFGRPSGPGATRALLPRPGRDAAFSGLIRERAPPVGALHGIGGGVLSVDASRAAAAPEAAEEGISHFMRQRQALPPR